MISTNAPPKMTPQEALKINAAMSRLATQSPMQAAGYAPNEKSREQQLEDAQFLQGVALADMLTATEIIREINNATEEGALAMAKSIGRGARVGHTMFMVCEPRIIAALYVSLHFEPGPLGKANVAAKVGPSMVVVLDTTTIGEED